MVYVVLADGFEEIEAIEPIDIMRRAGIEVTTASVMETASVTGAHGIPVKADITVRDVDPDNMELLFLPGGAGHTILDASNEVHALINHAVTTRKYIAAICAAPSILGKKQLLSGKKATCFPGFEKYCYGAEITGEKVTRDGMIITARGAGAAAELGFALVGILKDDKTAGELRLSMQYE